MLFFNYYCFDHAIVACDVHLVLYEIMYHAIFTCDMHFMTSFIHLIICLFLHVLQGWEFSTLWQISALYVKISIGKEPAEKNYLNFIV